MRVHYHFKSKRPPWLKCPQYARTDNYATPIEAVARAFAKRNNLTPFYRVNRDSYTISLKNRDNIMVAEFDLVLEESDEKVDAG